MELAMVGAQHRHGARAGHTATGLAVLVGLDHCGRRFAGKHQRRAVFQDLDDPAVMPLEIEFLADTSAQSHDIEFKNIHDADEHGGFYDPPQAVIMGAMLYQESL